MSRDVRAAEEAYSIAESAAIKRVSADTIRRAIRATSGNVLRAKNIGTPEHPRYRVPASALEEWFEGLDDA